MANKGHPTVNRKKDLDNTAVIIVGYSYPCIQFIS